MKSVTCQNGRNPNEEGATEDKVEGQDQDVGEPVDRRMAELIRQRIIERRIESVKVSVGSEVPEGGEQDEDVHHGPCQGQRWVGVGDLARLKIGIGMGDQVIYKEHSLSWVHIQPPIDKLVF